MACSACERSIPANYHKQPRASRDRSSVSRTQLLLPPLEPARPERRALNMSSAIFLPARTASRDESSRGMGRSESGYKSFLIDSMEVYGASLLRRVRFVTACSPQ